ncbi:hypothetical protein [Desulfoluna spongiiphila]|uniref:hypothetical protein n=1 Tax=Desulfoluna spongiiphila TaxID=419481 RepID=UPI001257372F|nr:hypothetical protein [Desulfoluna spongiiphila]VVS95244.1 hypothetical protein DBB_48210 [Desulfoluna spongiiphila]
MKESASPHLKVQELCDCYAETDPLKEMSAIIREPATEETALKWLALAVLHGVNSNAEKINLVKTESGKVGITATYRTTELPSPGEETGARILDIARAITHIETDKGKTDLALGFRGNSMELKIKIKKEKDRERITLHFPGEG